VKAIAAQYRLGDRMCQRRCRCSNRDALRAIRYDVTPRHAILPLGAVLVLGLGVYLFVEVRAQPAPIATVGGGASRTVVHEPSPSPSSPPPPRDEPAAVAPPTPPNAPPPRAAAPPALASAEDGDVPSAPPGPALVGPKLETAMAEANKAYDRGDFDEAKALAGRLLASEPTNVRMLRIMVSASCLDGDMTVAQAHYARLPSADQEQMKVRCARYGITFPDKP
jgi:hypothetical protein